MIQTTDTKKKTFSNLEFEAFLRSDQQTIRIPDKNSFTTLVKIDSGYHKKQFTYIAMETFSKPILRLDLERLDVIGIYDIQNEQVYILMSYAVKWHLNSLDTTKYIDFYSRKNSLREALRRIVYYQLDQQKDQMLSAHYEDVISDSQKALIQQEAKGFLLEGKPFERGVLIRLFDNEETPETVFDFLVDEEAELLAASEAIFCEEQESLYYVVCAEEYFNTYCQHLLADPDFLSQQRLYKAVKSKDMKSFTIHYKENGKELTFKVENNVRWQNDYLTAYDIQSPKLRNQFENEFSYYIHFQSIETITYAKKVIYQK